MATGGGGGRRSAEPLPTVRPGPVRRESRAGTPPDKKEKTHELSSSTMAEEPEPASCVVQGDNDIQAPAIKVEDLEELRAPHLPHDAGRIPVRREYIVQKHQPKETKKAPHLVAYPAFPEAPSKPLTSGAGLFGDGCEKILPHHILGSLEEFKMEALARGNTQLADLIELSRQDVSAAAVKEEDGGEKKEKVHPTPLAEHKALQNWYHNMAIRKKQEKYLGEILQRPENELLMNSADNYRQIQEERELIAQTLPVLQPGKGYQGGREFWGEPEYIGDELTGLKMQRARGYLQPVTPMGKPHTVQMETASKPLEKIPSRLTWDRSLFLQHRRQELKPILEEQGFYKPDLEGLEVIAKGQPFTSVSTEPFPCSSTSEESETLSDPLQDYPDVVPEAVQGPSLNFCGQPARWIECTTSRRNEIGIAARLSFEALVGEKAQKSLTVSNDGTTAIWYDWMRLPLQIPSRQTERIRMPCFYFDIRSGVILPGETREFSVIFKSERPGIFSESWEFRTQPLLLGGALLQVTFWGMAVYVDKLADVRKKLEMDLAAKEGVAIARDILRKHVKEIGVPARTPSPARACVTEEELFQKENPGFFYQHRVVKQLHELWRQHMTVPSAFEEKVPSGQKSTAEDTKYQESAQSSTTEVPGQKNTLEEAPSQTVIVEEEEPGPSGWNLSLVDLWKAMKSIPREEQREEALAQLNKAVLELRVEQRPVQPDRSALRYRIGLHLWRETIDNMVSHSMRLRSLLGLPENTTYTDDVPEETGKVKQPVNEGNGDRTAIGKEERSLSVKDEEDGKRQTKTAGKEKEKEEVKEGAQAVEAVTTDRAEPPQVQVDPVLFRQYQEKLYIGVYGLLKSMVDRMVVWFEDLED